MKTEELTGLTDEELLEVAKTMKSTKLYDSIIFGFLVGVAIYSSINNGFGLMTFLPLVYLPIAGKNQKKRNQLGKLLKERNLKYREGQGI